MKLFDVGFTLEMKGLGGRSMDARFALLGPWIEQSDLLG